MPPSSTVNGDNVRDLSLLKPPLNHPQPTHPPHPKSINPPQTAHNTPNQQGRGSSIQPPSLLPRPTDHLRVPDARETNHAVHRPNSQPRHICVQRFLDNFSKHVDF